MNLDAVSTIGMQGCRIMVLPGHVDGASVGDSVQITGAASERVRGLLPAC